MARAVRATGEGWRSPVTLGRGPCRRTPRRRAGVATTSSHRPVLVDGDAAGAGSGRRRRATLGQHEAPAALGHEATSSSRERAVPTTGTRREPGRGTRTSRAARPPPGAHDQQVTGRERHPPRRGAGAPDEEHVVVPAATGGEAGGGDRLAEPGHEGHEQHRGEQRGGVADVGLVVDAGGDQPEQRAGEGLHPGGEDEGAEPVRRWRWPRPVGGARAASRARLRWRPRPTGPPAAPLARVQRPRQVVHQRGPMATRSRTRARDGRPPAHGRQPGLAIAVHEWGDERLRRSCSPTAASTSPAPSTCSRRCSPTAGYRVVSWDQRATATPSTPPSTTGRPTSATRWR